MNLPVSIACTAYDVYSTDKYVKATARGSCSYCKWNYGTSAYKNQCPNCKVKKVLIFNPKNTYEGEWTCKGCGSDFCAKCGHEKVKNSKKLVKYTGKTAGPTFKQKKVKSIADTGDKINKTSTNKTVKIDKSTKQNIVKNTTQG